MFESKFPNLKTTIFSQMSSLANEVGAVNLSQGFPDFPTSDALIDCVSDAMYAGKNQYAPMAGDPHLKSAIAEKYRLMFDVNVDPDLEITITPGGTAALYTAIACVVRPLDEVLILSPAYDSYAPAVIANGGMPVYSDLLPDTFMPDWDDIAAKTTNKTVMIIINTPHNPTGTVWDADQYQHLINLVEKHDLFVLSDEVYELITFDYREHISVFSFPALRNRSFVVTSFGKTFHVTGWKIGACLAPSHLTSEFRKIHQFLSFSVNTPFQVGLANYMQNPDVYSGLSHFFQQKRDSFRGLIASTKFTILDCSGSYFQLLGYQDISNENDVAFAIRLARDFGVAAIPLSPFYPTDVQNLALRFCFAKNESTLELAAERLNKL